MKKHRFSFPLALGAAAAVALLSLARRSFAQGMTGAEITALTEIIPLPGHEAEVHRAATQIRAAALADPGCRYYFVTEKQNAPATLVLFEVFRSQRAFERHLADPSTRAFNASLKGHVEGDAGKVTLLHPQTGPVAAGDTADRRQAGRAPADASLPRGVDHVGLTVPNVDAAADFFCKAFGAEAIYDVQPAAAKPMGGAETEQQLGLPPGAQIVHMRLLRLGNGPTLELFGFAAAPHQPPASINDHGWTHVGLYVDDMEKAAARFEAAGGTLLSPPHSLAGVEAGRRNQGVYGRTPWGSLVELLTYPSGINYPNPQLVRWTPSED